MRTLVDQLEQSLGAKLFYLSLFGTLAIPDIAGALDSDDGHANGERYAQWFDAWVRPVHGESVDVAFIRDLPKSVSERFQLPQSGNPLTGEACYQFRCSMLHQGRSQLRKSPYERVLFVEPGTSTFTIHASVLSGALVIDLPTFCGEVVTGTRRWLDQAEGSAKFQANYERFAKRHPKGLAPYIVGPPVIG